MTMIRVASLTTGAILLGSTLAPGQSAPPRSAATGAPVRFVAIGCITAQGTPAARRYVITDRRGDSPTTYRLQGDTTQLQTHVGHTVEVAGPLTAPPAGSAQYVLRVSSLAWISNTCKKLVN
ncbi:MAG TPA: hypothetical protein VM032_18850 [Vicinamibacterales bacterium]|nr:hypothetical protein [Vicinamibacterales bacterium]